MSEDNDGFWDSGPGSGGDEIVRGRYRAPDPVTGEERDWTRVTNFADTTADQYGLTQWKLYKLLIGLSRRPDLQRLVSVLDEDDRKTQREIVESAHAAAAIDAEANEGTAIHRALALADAGQPYPTEFEPYVRSYHAELARNGLAVVPGMIEVTLCSRDLDVMGTTDRFLVDQAGEIGVGDIKTGRLDRNELGFRIQFSGYATATHYRHRGGAWQPMPVGEHAVSRTWAVLIKVDLEQQSCSLYTVDLVAGRRSANLARQVREDRRTRGTLLPYVPPPPLAGPVPISVDTPPADGSRRVADGVHQVYQLGEWMDEHPQPVNQAQGALMQIATETARATDMGGMTGHPLGLNPTPEALTAHHNGQRHLQAVPDPTPRPLGLVDGSGAEAEPAPLANPGQLVGEPPSAWLTPVGEIRVRPDGVAVRWNGQVWVPETVPSAGFGPAQMTPAGPVTPAPSGGGVTTCSACGKPTQTRDQLKKLDKAGLQQLCREHGVTENLSKNKDPLISYLSNKGHVVGETAGLAVPPGPAGPRLGDSQEITGQIGGSDPTDPRDQAFTDLRVARIREATTITQLGQIHAEVVRIGGQQAWNAQLDAEAKARASQLEPQGPPSTAAPTPIPSDDPFRLIAEATTQEDLGRIWSLVTLGGTQDERWTAEVGAAAAARLEAIQAAIRPVAVNPFAGAGVTS
jgi:hypothetical protein